MAALLKALLAGALLTFVVSFFAQPDAIALSWLDIRPAHISYFEFYWSWRLFVVSVVAGWGFFLLWD